jgi:hypothetical protein
MSHLSAFQAVPRWGINRPFYPSTSMTDWTTGEPNARYWVLKLLIDHLHTGSDIFSYTMPASIREKHFCAMSTARDGFPDINLVCHTKGATISTIEFASFGTPSGECGNYTEDPVCFDSSVVSYVRGLCLGKPSCTIPVFPLPWEDPCEGILETLLVQATCSTGDGEGHPYDMGLITVVPFVDSVSQHRKILVINLRNEDAIATLNAGPFNTAKMYTVDETTGAAGPAVTAVKSLKKVFLRPFATILIDLT